MKTENTSSPLKIATLIAAIFFSITACAGSANQPDPSTTSSICSNNLFPVKQGATWTYSSTGGPNGDFNFTDTITEIRADGFTLTSQPPNLSYKQEWLCTTDGLSVLQLSGGTTGSISTQNITAQFTTLQTTGVSLPRDITPGMKWQYDMQMEGSVPMPGEQTQSPVTFSLAMQELGKETITIPAGTFNADKIQAAFVVQINADFQGSTVPYTINGSSIVWYAPGVGYIKSIENVDFSGTPFTSTTELLSYNIP